MSDTVDFAQIRADLEAFGHRLDRLEAILRRRWPDRAPRTLPRPEAFGARDFTELQEAIR